LLLVGAIALVLTFAQAPGQVSPDTKLDLTANPLRFLARATNLWNSDLPLGQAQNQAYGYLFPHGTFFLLGHLLGLPGWITQRVWWALLLAVGFWGLLRVAETLVQGRTEWDGIENTNRPCVIIDGRRVEWDDFGAMLLAFEGWRFRLEMLDPSDEA